MFVKGGTGGLAYFGAGAGVGGLRAGLGLGDRCGAGGFVLVVAVDAADGEGEFGEPAAPGLEAVTDDAKGVAGASKGVAAMVGVVGVVVDGVEQPGRAGASFPPGSEQGPGTPEGHPGYPPAV